MNFVIIPLIEQLSIQSATLAETIYHIDTYWLFMLSVLSERWQSYDQCCSASPKVHFTTAIRHHFCFYRFFYQFE